MTKTYFLCFLPSELFKFNIFNYYLPMMVVAFDPRNQRSFVDVFLLMAVRFGARYTMWVWSEWFSCKCGDAVCELYFFSSSLGDWSQRLWSRSWTPSLDLGRSSSTGSSWEWRASSVSSQRRWSGRSVMSTAGNFFFSSPLSSLASPSRLSRWGALCLGNNIWTSSCSLHATETTPLSRSKYFLPLRFTRSRISSSWLWAASFASSSGATQ